MGAILSVNLNAVAMLRNRRNLPWPNVEHIGRLALAAGALGLTVHPRPDQRHTRDSDLPILRALIDDEYCNAEFNIEGYPTPEFIALALANEPEQVTLVPDDPDQATSDHGWDFEKHADMLAPIVKTIKNAGARVALFCDPDASEKQIELVAEIGADRIEIYTEPYAACFDDVDASNVQAALLARTATYAKKSGLGVNAGHDLTVDNLPGLVEAVPHLAEVSIGHGLTADSLEFGIGGSVKRFLRVLDQ